jgi:hypothetical protein
MEVTNIKCEVCGAVKGETNHWLDCVTVRQTTEATGGALNLAYAAKQPAMMAGIAFAPLGTPLTDPSIQKEHICSQACAVKRFSQWLGTLA